MSPPLPTERRKRVRAKVQWAILLLPEDAGEVVESVTRDLSSVGFYCLSPKLFSVGESLFCALKVPTYDPTGEDQTMTVECRVRVVRAEETEEGAYGIACQIEDYQLSAVERSLTNE